MTKRILSKFRITEISAVDRPASEHARVVIMKRFEPKGITKMDTEFTQKQVGENALAKLNALADELNEREPSLTIDQCFSKVYQDPKNRDLVARERFGNGFVKAMPSSLEVVGVEKAMPVVESLDPIEERDMALGKLKEMAAKFRENHPELTAEQAFSKVYLMNPDLQKAERRASRRALGIAEDAIRAMTR